MDDLTDIELRAGRNDPGWCLNDAQRDVRRLIAALRTSREDVTNLENQLAAAADVIADMEGPPESGCSLCGGLQRGRWVEPGRGRFCPACGYWGEAPTPWDGGPQCNVCNNGRFLSTGTPDGEPCPRCSPPSPSLGPEPF